jgi:hypothetical protein
MEPSQGRQKGKAKERPKDAQLAGTKKRRNLVVGTYLTHSPSHVACMQIMKSNNNERFRIHITGQNNFPFYRKGLKIILTHCLKN